MIVLDTYVLSELLRPAPSPIVEAWLGAQHAASVFITSVAEAEIRYGIARMDHGRRRQQLEHAVISIFNDDFAGRILPFDSEAACAYAAVVCERLQAGRPISQFDAQIAAITRSRGGLLATRNVRDFEGTGIVIVDPWGYGA